MEHVNVVDQEHGEMWSLYCGDSAEVLGGLPDASIDFSIFSPPFQSLYTYSPSERDLGNSHDPALFWEHFGYVSAHLRRLVKPGRIVAVHCAQLISTKAHHGEIGMIDFRGDTIRHFRDTGWIHHGEIAVQKNPQAQAVRTKSKSLLFVQLEKDRAWLRPALADFVLLFRAPGENAVPITGHAITRDEWISWAHPVWTDIRESDTLNAAVARENADERHICPLQLPVIERCIRLWTNPGEVVLSPFAGIGSEVREAVRLGRRGIGVELKPSYFRTAVRNVRAVEHETQRDDLFSLSGVVVERGEAPDAIAAGVGFPDNMAWSGQ